MSDLRGDIDAAAGVGGEVLDIVGESFVVADVGSQIVRGVDGCDEQADLLHGSHHSPGTDVIPHFERAQDDEEGSRGEVACHWDTSSCTFLNVTVRCRWTTNGYSAVPGAKQDGS
jgi:hypothetical protein